MTQTELSKQGVDRGELNAGSSAGVAKVCGSNMVLPVRLDKRQLLEGFNDLRACGRPCEALQKLLKDESCRDDDFISEQCFSQRLNLRDGYFDVPPQAE